tara:strand:+ start:4130 stop:4717 length:588 start_codon:yes stop_codon:yes gene_type:complete
MRQPFAILLLSASLVGCQTAEEIFADVESNPGACPSALTLYDAHRSVEFADPASYTNGQAVYSGVSYTGELLAVRSLCRYYEDRPIIANLEIDMGFGRGPAATAETHTYRYFVAVTRRDTVVIHRETFPITVRFRPGEDRVFLQETIDRITIPRADEGISGDNFEIIVGFDLTEDQIAWNRTGQRFRANSGTTGN